MPMTHPRSPCRRKARGLGGPGRERCLERRQRSKRTKMNSKSPPWSNARLRPKDQESMPTDSQFQTYPSIRNFYPKVETTTVSSTPHLLLPSAPPYPNSSSENNNNNNNNNKYSSDSPLRLQTAREMQRQDGAARRAPRTSKHHYRLSLSWPWSQL